MFFLKYNNNLGLFIFIIILQGIMIKDTYILSYLKSDYKTLESRFTSLRNTIQNKLPEIEKTLEALHILKEKEVRFFFWYKDVFNHIFTNPYQLLIQNTDEELETDYELTYGTTLATGVIKPGCPVYLCLGVCF